jgi:hypothetical protein
VPANLKTNNRAQKLPLKFVDPAVVLDEDRKWKKLWDEIVLAKAEVTADGSSRRAPACCSSISSMGT